ncbi:MAG: hypothetical protein AUJ52_15080 [Elusimicrobia bacterium CG1_02_63_36]|nr:MAG: hypothetical protein AUJ52_15080 [Elusimicrobia bacterium CG1_02_63_36]PIP84964.1 MAG: hypothetical protein COR54_01215 [Elusimicrobia bacterium CG22_combo_CG10-13_8_21_14_all_63_91]PJA12382.1 MAG: hypothetical protein COX66_17500 [Elusimicrobia bacterium CG_4_10_14_0_2_um_filter_63_34]PJB26161.1 MAG: hypothetical protein CO113_04920 [Elusimicrobia bacterium CG_4_9_14_3_um_filter_62_55]
MKVGLALAFASAFAACAGPRPAVVRPVPELRGDIAVLPFNSMSTSLRGPQLLRELTQQKLSGFGWDPVPLEAADAALRGIGISDGGQLRSIASEKVAAALGVDRYVVGMVNDFSDQNLGFVRRRIVELELSVVDGKSGETLWKNTGRFEKSKAALSRKKAELSFLEGVLENAAEKAYGKPMDQESRQAVDRAMMSFPRR